MKNTIKKIVLLISLVFVSSIISLAQAKSLFIAGCELHPMNDETHWEIRFGAIYADNTSPNGKFMSTVCLPDGAKITKFGMNFSQDEEPTFTVTLYRRNMYTDIEQVMATLESHNTLRDFVMITTNNIWARTINYSGYCYYVVVDFPPDALGPNNAIAGIKFIYTISE